MSELRRECTFCSKTGSDTDLKQCARCLAVDYCSRECQKQHWKTHRRDCVATIAVPTTTHDVPILDAIFNQQRQSCYKVSPIPGKGQGLLATHDIPRGTSSQLRGLSGEQQNAFYHLHTFTTTNKILLLISRAPTLLLLVLGLQKVGSSSKPHASITHATAMRRIHGTPKRTNYRSMLAETSGRARRYAYLILMARRTMLRGNGF